MNTTERNNLSGTPHQRELKVRNQLTESMFQDMLAMLEELTPDERRTLKDPDFITEDEADIIVCDRRADEETLPAEDVLRELGIPVRKRA